MSKVVRLAKEGRLVRRDRIDHLGHFAVVVAQQADVRFEVRHAMLAKAAGEPPLQQRALRLGDLNAGRLHDQRAQYFEFASPEWNRQHCWRGKGVELH
jgi:hypothetical protein